MNLGWLAALGILLLLVGIATLAYDGIRRKHGNSPYPFPDEATNRLNETAVQRIVGLLPSTRRPLPRAANLLAILQRIKPASILAVAPGGASRARADFLTRFLLAIPRRAHAAIVVGSLLLIVMSVVLLLPSATTARHPAGETVLGIAGFSDSGATGTARSLAEYVQRSAAASGITNLDVRYSSVSPADAGQAEKERARLAADILLWSEPGSGATLTASVTLAPGFSVGRQEWQQFVTPDIDMLVLPTRSSIYIPTANGPDPLVPLALALVYLHQGNYKAALDAGWGSQATLDETGGEGQVARIVEASARLASGDYGGSRSAIADMAQHGPISPEARLLSAAAKFYSLDYAGASVDLNQVIEERDSSDRLLANAFLLRARVQIESGNLKQGMADLDESQRLNLSDWRAALVRSEILYRQAKPSEAATELERVIKAAPNAAPAYRLMGLVRLMLAQPEEALKPLGAAKNLYSGWITTLRAEEAQATANGDASRTSAATQGILTLNHELSGVALYEGMAWADIARKEPKESFLGGIWRGIRGEPATWERALSKMEEAARFDPRRPDVPLQIGTLYTQHGDFTAAATALQQARDLDPNASEPYFALAHLQEAQGRPDDAVATLNDLIDHAPRDFGAYDALHALFNHTGDTARAASTLERAFAIQPQSALDHLWRGKFLRTLGRLGEAEVELRSATQDPQLWEAHILLGQTLVDTGRGPEALIEFQTVLTLEPNNETALLDAGRLLVLAGKQDDAQTLFARLTGIAPNNVDGHIALLELLLARGDVDAAIDEGRRAVAADANRADAHYFVGLALETKGDRHSASTEYKTATERDPNDFQAFLSLSRSLFLEDRYADALEASRKTIALRPDDPQPYRWKAEAEWALGDTDSALGTLGTALRLNASDADALALTAKAYAAKGDDASALDFEKQASAIQPKNPAGPLALGDLLLSRGRAREALQAYGSCLDLGSAHTQSLAMVGEGRAFAALGDTDKAMQMYAAAAAKDPTAAEPYLYLGNLYAEASKPDDAQRAYRRAVQIRPNWPLALYCLGRTMLQAKDLQNAQAAFTRAVTYAPNMVEAWFGLGIAQRGQEHSREAIEALTHAVQLNSTYHEAWLYLGLTYEEAGERAHATDAFGHAQGSPDAGVAQQAEQGLARVR